MYVLVGGPAGAASIDQPVGPRGHRYRGSLPQLDELMLVMYRVSVICPAGGQVCSASQHKERARNQNENQTNMKIYV